MNNDISSNSIISFHFNIKISNSFIGKQLKNANNS